VSLRVELVVPDRELWSGQASTVIAKTLEGDIGVLTGHSPVFGVLTVQVRIRAAVSGGFLSVSDDRVSILAAQAELAGEINVEQTRQELAAALAEATPGAEDSPAVRYARARLRAAGQD